MVLGTVIVTRPAHQAQAICHQLQQAGFTPIAIPALQIEALHDEMSVVEPRWTDYALIHFSSPNAILHSLGQLAPEQRRFKPGTYVCVMGPGSQQTLQQYLDTAPLTIFSPQQAGQQRLDSEALIQVLQSQALSWRGLKVLLVKGQGGRSAIAQWLTQQGAQLTRLEVYKRVPAAWSQAIEHALGRALSAPNCFTLMTSSEAVQAWAQLLQHRPDYAQTLSTCPLLVTHPRVAQAAQRAGFSSVHLTIPSDEAVLAKLKSLATYSAG